MEKGYFALVLHGHLPYVRHPEYNDFLEEDWLYEAITETYLPLLEVFEGLKADSVDFHLTMSLSPTLVSMLLDPLLQNRYIHHIEKLVELSEKEIHRTRNDQAFNYLAHMYNGLFKKARHDFVERYHKNLPAAFNMFQQSGNLEIMTCGATHAFLPLNLNEKARRAQIRVAADYHRKVFGTTPRGIWLPECGYNPGDENYLKEQDIRFFVVDSHGLLYGSPRPKYGVFAPVFCPNGTAAFGRDIESSAAVWSKKEGYPGDFLYRDFYRDVGFDLDFNYIKDYIHVDGTRINTGIKYYRITGPTDHKEPYHPQWAASRAAEHAGNFLSNRQKQAEYLIEAMGGKKPVIVSPYDAELFGHWWFEGPQWINFLFRKMHFDQDIVRSVSLAGYLDENPVNQVIQPSLSSWGYMGYAEYWLNDSNDWIYRHLNKAADRMEELVNSRPNASGCERRALNQALREFMLAQSSDWPFIMKTGEVTPYAVKRFKDHIERFTKLYDAVKNNRIDEMYLSDLESKDNLFSDIDYRVYS